MAAEGAMPVAGFRHHNNKTIQAVSALRTRAKDNALMSIAKLKEICKEAGLPTCPQAVRALMV